MKSILSVLVGWLLVAIIGAVAVTVLHTCCRDGIVKAIPALDGRGYHRYTE